MSGLTHVGVFGQGQGGKAGRWTLVHAAHCCTLHTAAHCALLHTPASVVLCDLHMHAVLEQSITS